VLGQIWKGVHIVNDVIAIITYKKWHTGKNDIKQHFYQFILLSVEYKSR